MTAAQIAELLAAAERYGCRFRLENDRLVADGLEHLPEPLGRVLYQRRAELRATIAGAVAAWPVEPGAPTVTCGICGTRPADRTTSDGLVACSTCAAPDPLDGSPCARGCIADPAACQRDGCAWWREFERARDGSW